MSVPLASRPALTAALALAAAVLAPVVYLLGAVFGAERLEWDAAHGTWTPVERPGGGAVIALALTLTAVLAVVAIVLGALAAIGARRRGAPWMTIAGAGSIGLAAVLFAAGLVGFFMFSEVLLMVMMAALVPFVLGVGALAVGRRLSV